MRVKVKIKDTGYKAFFRKVKRLDEAVISVGVHEKEGRETYPGGATVAQIAQVHEFGSPSRAIPERSFVRSFADEKRAEFPGEARRQVDQDVLRGRTVDVALRRVALRLEGEMKQKVIGGVPPALSQTTIDRKGSSTPLIDTGQMLQAIEGKVSRG